MGGICSGWDYGQGLVKPMGYIIFGMFIKRIINMKTEKEIEERISIHQDRSAKLMELLSLSPPESVD